MYFIYSLLFTLALLVLLPRFLLDAFRHGKYVAGFRERLGALPAIRSEGRPVVWLHCVSVGETQAARALVAAIRRRFPDHLLAVSTVTLTGQMLARQVFKDDVIRICYFPFDWRWTVRRALRAINPSVVLIMETELWPVFLRECRGQHIPVAIVNGRLSAKSFRRYRMIPGFISRVVRCLNIALMQTEADASRMRALGVEPERILVSGNLKFDAGAIETGSLPEELRERFGFEDAVPVILAASTHAPEERIILEAFRRIERRNGSQKPRLVIAPRHPERFAEVASLLNASARRWVRRTDQPSRRDSESEVILLDTIGELPSVFTLASLVFVGGSIAPTGGHNVLEPAAVGACIITGAHTENFKEIVATFVAADSICQLPAVTEMEAAQVVATVFNRLLDDPERAKALGARAKALVEQNRGATERTVDILTRILAIAPAAQQRESALAAQEDARSAASSASSIVLRPLSVFYGAVTRARLALYERGLLQLAKLDAPVISVGNITTGGTGKTPLVEWVARTLAGAGRQVCILTRGYGRASPNTRIVVSDRQRILANEVAAGDEPQLLAENLLGLAAVISDKDRLAAGQWAVEEFGCDVFILDDGFQHLRLARDLNIVTIDATNPWGNSQLLPYGRLREPRRGLLRADCVVITRADQGHELDSLKREIEKLSHNRPIFTSHMRGRGLRRLGDQPSIENYASGRSVERPTGAFCAIGNPGSFFRQLQADGFNLLFTRAFPDHQKYDQSYIDDLVEAARRAGAKSLITTAKDAVKLRALTFDLPCYVLEIEIVIDDSHELIRMIRTAIRK